MADEPTTRFRPNLISEIALSADGGGRPIHIFRAGTYTDMAGRETTFAASDIQAILANFQAGKRRRPPITERHDWGRAVGRIASIWSDAAHENLYAQPNWNGAGRALLTEEVYDGFSCELDLNDTGWTLIGGSLTNYPAVDGLEPVTLEAPQEERPTAPGGARDDIHPTEENTPMSDDTRPAVDAPAADPPPPIALADVDLSALDQARIERLVADREQAWQERERLLLAEAETRFERRIAEERARTAIQQYAQHATTPTLQRQHALPLEPQTLATFLSSLNGAQRKEAQALFDRILDGGLVSFEEIGSQGDGGDEPSAKERFDAAVATKVGTGMSRLTAMQAVAKDKPDLYAAYQAESLTPKVRPTAPAKKGGA